MLKYFSTKNVENIRYEISVLKNTNLINHEINQINQVETLINISKTFCRLYFAMEVCNLLYFLYKRRRQNNMMIGKRKNILIKFAYLYLRLNIIWLSSNFGTNYYIENYTNIKKIINKYKLKNTQVQFKQFIEHKY